MISFDIYFIFCGHFSIVESLIVFHAFDENCGDLIVISFKEY